MRTWTLSLVVALAGCSLGALPEPDACADHQECRTLFGAAFYCGADGRCEDIADSTACTELFPADARTETEAVLFGTIFDRDSPNQQARERAAQLAVAGMNGGGGIGGRTVALVHCDTDLATPAEAANFLAEIGVPAVIGPSTSAQTQSVFSDHAASGDLLVISPSATAAQLDAADSRMPGLLWRTAPPDTLQAQVLMSELASVTSLRIIARQNDVYSQGLSVLLQDAATALGIDVSGTQFSPDGILDDAITAAATTAVSSAPDAVVFVSSQVGDAALFLEIATDIGGFDGVDIWLTDAAANEELLGLIEDVNTRHMQVQVTRPATPDTLVTTEFQGAYGAAYGGDDPLQFSFTAHTYDAAALVVLGAAFAFGRDGEISPAGIAEGISRMARPDGTEPRRLIASEFSPIVAALGAGTVDVLGASGALDYDADEELTTASYDVLGLIETGVLEYAFEVRSTVDVPLP